MIKSSSLPASLLLLIAVAASSVDSYAHEHEHGPGYRKYTPFDMVEDYVNQFKSRLDELYQTADEFKFTEESRSNSLEEEHHEEAKELAGAPEFDFIVIGAGTSGSVVASRLSEEPRWKVLLLEAGTYTDEITDIPSLHPRLINSPYAWGYYTVPQNTTCLGMEDQKCLIKKGKAFGGDTAVNEMLFTRGHPKDYDIWADSGLKGWCWESLEPYFKKIETAHLTHMDKKYRHYGGPIHLENFDFKTKIAEHLLDSCHEHYKVIDYNGKERVGFGVPQVISKEGKRYSVAKAYLDGALKRDNLKLELDSRVVRIIIGEHTKEAMGVKYVHDGKVHFAKAKKEIVLAAGAVNSPQVLLLSGVGPKEELEHLGIPHIVDLKVGHQLKDHISITLKFLYNITQDHYKYGNHKEDLVNYLKDNSGPLTTTGLELVGFLKTKFAKEHADYPDIQLLIRREQYKPDCNYWHKSMEHSSHPLDHHCEHAYRLSIEVILLHPKSSGYLKLVDKDPFRQPLINPYGLSDEEEEDIETLVAGVHETLKFVEGAPLQKIGLKLEEEHVPKCESKDHGDEYWKCIVRHSSVYRGDITGTAKMGFETEKLAVVDEKLHVLGVHKLRVADASIIPVTISGNVMAPEIVIGEKAADIIKHEWL